MSFTSITITVLALPLMMLELKGRNVIRNFILWQQRQNYRRENNEFQLRFKSEPELCLYGSRRYLTWKSYAKILSFCFETNDNCFTFSIKVFPHTFEMSFCCVWINIIEIEHHNNLGMVNRVEVCGARHYPQEDLTMPALYFDNTKRKHVPGHKSRWTL